MRIDVDDVDDPRVAPYMGLRDHVVRQARERPGGDAAGWFMAEGLVVIERARRAGLTPVSVLADARRAGEAAAAVAEDIAVYAATPAVLTAISGRAKLRDPIACYVRPPLKDADSLLGAAGSVAVLEGIVNPTNMGVIMRCAAGLGIDAVLIDPTCCDPLYRRAVRVSMGEVFAVPHARIGAVPDEMDRFHRCGFEVVALTPDADALALGDYASAPGAGVAIVLGTEGPGLSACTLEAADARLRIPMAASVDSINVGSAAAVAFYALGRSC